MRRRDCRWLPTRWDIPAPQLLQAVWSRAALQAGSCLGLCSEGVPHTRTSPHVCLTCQRAGAGQAALLWTLPPAAWGLPHCAPSFQGLGLVTASWHVLLRPRAPGEAAALHTHLTLTISCSVLTSPMAAPCPLTSSPLLLTPGLGVCLSVSWLSQAASLSPWLLH